MLIYDILSTKKHLIREPHYSYIGIIYPDLAK